MNENIHQYSKIYKDTHNFWNCKTINKILFLKCTLAWDNLISAYN